MKYLATTFIVSSLLLPVSARAAESTKKADGAESAVVASDPGNYVFESWVFYLDQIDRRASTVYFDPKSALVPAIEKMRIQDWAIAYKNANTNPKVIVASWSDKEYPKAPAMKLDKSERELADMRNKNIADILKNVGITSIEMYNMAERPNWFQRVFASDSAQIKGEAKDKNWDSVNEDKMASILKRRGGPSKAVLILRPVADSGSLTSGR